MSVSENNARVGFVGSPGWVKVGLALGGLGLVLWGVRWLVQGGDTIYTDVARAFWVEGTRGVWVETTDRWVWLGLEGLGAVVAVVVGTAAMLWLSGRVKRPAISKVTTALSRVGAVVAMVTPALPAWAFISGMPPAGAERLMPLAPAPVAPVAGVGGAVAALVPFDLPTGTWALADTKTNLLTARVSAGGETLDAKFGPLTGSVDLAADLVSSKAGFTVPATSVDTGIELRNSHAQGYLSADQHATIGLTIPRLTTVGAGGDPESRNFETEGELSFMGKTLTLKVTGSLTKLSREEMTGLGVDAPQALLVNASLTLPVKDTPLDPKNFDTDQIPLTARLVLVPAAPRP